MADRWDCHEHRKELRVSFGFHTVFHPVHGVLCQSERAYDVFIYHPIEFKSVAAAQKWIDTGFISELQEELCNLGVGFCKRTIQPR